MELALALALALTLLSLLLLPLLVELALALATLALSLAEHARACISRQGAGRHGFWQASDATARCYWCSADKPAA